MHCRYFFPDHIAGWDHHMLALVAGDDKLIDAGVTRDLLSRIEKDVVTEVSYPDNYHENFNELNREEVYKRIVEWVEPRLGK